jgi:serine/threonine-protein kinase
MKPADKATSVCAVCGSTIDRASAELGCIACLLNAGCEEPEECKPAGSSSPQVPDQFGSYRIERREDGSLCELGRGAMGVTYRALDTSLNRAVALKIIQSDLRIGNSQARERFMREARAAASLRHPNVATVYQFGIREETGQCFCAMELIEGETLEDRVRRTGPLDVASVVEIARQIAAALAAAEKRGLVHRDLKPANIMIQAPEPGTSTPDGPTVKIIDFGIAKALSQTPDVRVLTNYGFIGTPAFASPEQFAGAKVDSRSDIYSLGATLYYLLSGRVLLPANGLTEGKDAAGSVTSSIYQLRAAHVPASLAALLTAMVADEPAARPSVTALATQLEQIHHQLADPRKQLRRVLAVTATLLVVAACAATLMFRPFASTAPSNHADVSRKTIAVLPFENLSDDASKAYFADGMQDDVLTSLAKIKDLTVISRTSTLSYRNKAERNLKVIGKELGVAHVLEGSVRPVGNRVVINVQLIETTSDHHRWAESYDRSVEQIFAIRSEIAEKVASALHATLSPEETVALKKLPTQNEKAYDLFLRAEHLFRVARDNPSSATLPDALELYRQAIAEDPQFALAYARRSSAGGWLRFGAGAASAVAPEEPRIDAEKALALQPDLPEAHLALAHCAFDRFDYPNALEHLARAQALAPQSAEVYSTLGATYARQLRFEEAVRMYERATHFDPGNVRTFIDLGMQYWSAGRTDQVEAPLKRALALDPTSDSAAFKLAEFFIAERGDVEGARQLLRRDKAALAYSYILTREYQTALRLFEELPADFVWVAFNGLTKDEMLGLFLHGAGQVERARPLLEAARHRWVAVLEDPTVDGRALAYNLVTLASIENALGNRAAALQLVKRAEQSDYVTRNLGERQSWLGQFAQIYAQAGDHDRAIAIITEVLESRPGFTAITPFMLRLDPVWDPLRNDPRFQALLTKYPAKAP